MHEVVTSSPGGNVLYDNEFVTLSLDEDTEILTMTRTREPLGSTEEELRAFYDGLVEVLNSVDRASVDLLIDSRAALGRNDDVFEAIQAEYRDSVFGGFRSVACVLRTVAGKLQLTRYGDEIRQLRVAMFDQMEDALEHLLARRERLSWDAAAVSWPS